MTVILVAVATGVVNLVIAELVGWFPWIAERIVRRAVRVLPHEHRTRYEEEWLAEMDVIPGRGISSLIFAIRIRVRTGRTRRELLELPHASLYERKLSITIKHATDRAMAGFLLTFLAPILLMSALAIRLTSRGPVLYRQTRVGRDGSAFAMYKFRSTNVAHVNPPTVLDAHQVVSLPSHDRPTWLGRLLRYSSLDELPQLLNVFKGDMSFIGPRPELREFVYLFEKSVGRYQDRHRVKPGITGWAQVHSLRGETSLAERVELDNYYISHWSFRLEAKIVLLTLIAVFRAAD